MGSKVFLEKASSNLGKLVSRPFPFLTSPKQQANVWNTSLVPTSFLKMDWGNKESKTTVTKTLPSRKAATSDKFCYSLQQAFRHQPEVKTTSVLPPTLIESSNSVLPKILRSLRNFFRFSDDEQSLDDASVSVRVVHRSEENYELWVNNRLVASLPSKLQADLLQTRLRRLFKSSFNATQFKPGFVDGTPALMIGNRFLFGVDEEISQKVNRSADLLAIEWVNNLRAALQAPVLSLVEGQIQMYGLKPTPKKLSGLASWYGDYFHGRQTANGEIYDQDEFTVAHKTLPFNTYLHVTNKKTGKAVILRVNDRGPYIPPRSLDLSRVASRCIGSEVAGVVPYEAVIMQPTQVAMTLNSKIDTSKLKPARKVAVISDF
jgi:rare lipoprotein A